MSELRRYAVVLIGMGLLGVASMLMYLAAYRRLGQDLIPVSHRRRAMAWRRSAPRVLVASAAAVAIGLVLLAATTVTLAADA